MATANPTVPHLLDPIVTALKERRTGPIGDFWTGYLNKYGTYIVAARGKHTADKQSRDLLALVPKAGADGTRVIPLTDDMNPDNLRYISTAIDKEN